MIDINEVKSIYLYTNKVDMRMGINKVEILLSVSFSPIEILFSAFIFVSKNKMQVRIYYENEFGKWLMINKLSYITFHIPCLAEKMIITKDDLNFLLKGVAIIDERKREICI